MTTLSEPQEPPPSFKLNTQVRAWLGARPGKPRAWGFHPSEMKEMCPVLHYYVAEARDALASEDGEKVAAAFGFLRRMIDAKAQSFNPGIQMELREGDYIHDDVRYYLGMLGVLVGKWRCTFCHAVAVQAGPLERMPRVETLDMSDRATHDAAPCSRCLGRHLRNGLAQDLVQ